MLATRPVTACAVGAMLGLLVAALAPTYIKVDQHAPSAGQSTARLIPFSAASPSAAAALWGAELLSWTMIGGLIALAARESGRDRFRSIGWGVAVAVCLSGVIEIVQIIVPGRYADATSVVLALAGSAVGASFVARSADRDPRRWIMPGLWIWWAATLLAAWSPLQFAWPAQPFWKTEMIVPFWSYFASRNLEDLTDVLGQVIVFLPMGALLAARSWRTSFVRAVAIGFVVGVLLEAGQIFIPSRSPDMSDALSSAAGAALGWSLWRWGEFARNSPMGVSRYRVGHRITR
jgi:VanZ family protein